MKLKSAGAWKNEPELLEYFGVKLENRARKEAFQKFVEANPEYNTDAGEAAFNAGWDAAWGIVTVLNAPETEDEMG